VSDTETNGRSLKRIGRGLFVVAAGSGVLANYSENLESRLKRDRQFSRGLSGELRQWREREVPLARDYSVEAFANRVRLNVGDESREDSSIPSNRLSVLPPGNRFLWQWRGDARPYIRGSFSLVMRCSHLQLRPVCDSVGRGFPPLPHVSRNVRASNESSGERANVSRRRENLRQKRAEDESPKQPDEEPVETFPHNCIP
jgi:hypothetical protein